MSPRGTSQSGLAAFVLLVHAVGLLAALTQVAHRLWPGIEARAGVFVMGLVPPHPSLGLAAVLAVAYAGAVALLYERSRLAWWYCLALMAALFVVPGRGRHDWVVNAAMLVLLAVPPGPPRPALRPEGRGVVRRRRTGLRRGSARGR